MFISEKQTTKKQPTLKSPRVDLKKLGCVCHTHALSLSSFRGEILFFIYSSVHCGILCYLVRPYAVLQCFILPFSTSGQRELATYFWIAAPLTNIYSSVLQAITRMSTLMGVDSGEHRAISSLKNKNFFRKSLNVNLDQILGSTHFHKE